MRFLDRCDASLKRRVVDRRGSGWSGLPDLAARRNDRKGARQPAVDRDRLAIDVRGVVRGEEQRHVRNLLGRSGAAQWVELSDLVAGAPGARRLEQAAS